MHPNTALITSFYEGFRQRDHRAMAACYHDAAHFSDPAFVDLNGNQVRAMWHMLCERGTDLQVEASNVEAEADGGHSTRTNPRIVPYAIGCTARR